MLRILDSHVHLAGKHLDNNWVDNDLNTDAKTLHPTTSIPVNRTSSELLEQSFISETKSFNVDRLIFVECGNDDGSLKETKWALGLANDPSSRIAAVVAHIPVPQGADAVRNWITSIREDNQLPLLLRGGRIVLLGNPMPAIDTCLSEDYNAGLSVLEEHNLHWEWCCHSSALANISVACAKRPNMTFVLDHLGRNGGTEQDIEEWKKGIELIAQQPNVYVKIGAIEEWGVQDPHPLLDFAIQTLGFARCMFESNWFVSKACGFSYEKLVETTIEALKRNGAEESDVLDVFFRNAEKVYKL